MTALRTDAEIDAANRANDPSGLYVSDNVSPITGGIAEIEWLRTSSAAMLAALLLVHRTVAEHGTPDELQLLNRAIRIGERREVMSAVPMANNLVAACLILAIVCVLIEVMARL